MKKLLFSCSLGLCVLLASMSSKAGWYVDWNGDALLSGGNGNLRVSCGNPNQNICMRFHFEGIHLKRVEVFPAQVSQTIELPPGTTLNGIPVEAINENNIPGPVVDIDLPN